MTAAEHLQRCLTLLDELAGMGADPAAIGCFHRLCDAVEAGLAEVGDDPELERLRDGVLRIGAAGLAAGVVERARIGEAR